LSRIASDTGTMIFRQPGRHDAQGDAVRMADGDSDAGFLRLLGQFIQPRLDRAIRQDIVQEDIASGAFHAMHVRDPHDL
jgi:hypothetical protein